MQAFVPRTNGERQCFAAPLTLLSLSSDRMLCFKDLPVYFSSKLLALAPNRRRVRRASDRAEAASKQFRRKAVHPKIPFFYETMSALSHPMREAR